MRDSRRWARRATVVAVALAAGGAVAVGSAAATTLNTMKGGYRNVANNGDTSFAFGLQGAVMETATNATFTSGLLSFPATDASGNTSLSVNGGGDRYVREKTPPAGWQSLATLNWGGSQRDYEASTPVPNNGSVTAQISGNDVRFINRYANPALPQATCGTGIKVLLVLDTSGSTSGFNNAYNAAAKTFITSLSGTPTQLKISSFATNSSPGATVYNLAVGADQTAAKARIDAIYPNNTSGTGFTNWDAALQDASKADVDVVVMVTDGNPTVRQGALGSATSDYRNIAFGVASANLAKNPPMTAAGRKQTIMAVGVGSGIAVENLKAISGPDVDSDYTTAADPSALAAVLAKLTQQICPTDLEITKTGPATIAPGATVNYDVTVKNNGAANIPFSSISVTDPGATLTPPANPPASLASGQSLTWKATKTAGTTCNGDVANTATVALVNLPGYSDTVPGNNSSTWHTQIVCPVSLAIEKTGDATVAPGGTINYVLKVSNTGNFPVPFADINVTDPGATIVAPGETSPLAPGTSRNWLATRTTLEVIGCDAVVPNTANVALGTQPGYSEQDTSDNSSTWNTRVVCPIDLTIQKKGDATVQPGGVISYTIVVTNTGKYSVPTSSVVMTDVPLQGLSGPTPDVASLDPQGTLTWTGTIPVPADEALCNTSASNTATVSLTQSTGFVLAPGTHESTALTGIVCPLSVGISKTATNGPVQPGGVATYDVTVTNDGQFTVPFAAIDVQDPGATLLPPANTDPLAPGDSRVWTASKQVPSDQGCGVALNNTATVALVAQQLPADAVQKATAVNVDAKESSASTPVVCPVQVAVSKGTGQTAVQPGGTVNYTIAVTNPGDFAVPGSAISVVDPGATLGEPDSTGDLAPGATRTWPASKSVALDPATCGTQVTNTASVFLEGLPVGWVDSGAGARSASATAVGVDGGICASQVQIQPQPEAPVAFRPVTGALGISKTGPRSSLAGGRVTFQITVTNNGAGDLTGVVIRDQPPAAMLLTRVPTGATRTGGRVIWNIGTLASGQSVTKTVTVRMLRTIRGRSCNTATAIADGTDQVASRACTTVQAGRRPATPVTG